MKELRQPAANVDMTQAAIRRAFRPTAAIRGVLTNMGSARLMRQCLKHHELLRRSAQLHRGALHW